MEKYREIYERKLKNMNEILHQISCMDQAEEMPQEYARLKPQNIHTLIAVPVYANRSLTGFIGVDNPTLDSDDTLINLLSNVGGHLGSVCENMRIQKIMEKTGKFGR